METSRRNIEIIDLIIAVNKNDDNTNYLGVNEYPGIGYIKSYLNAKNFTVNIHIVNNGDLKNLSNIFKHYPKIIGIGMYSDNSNLVLSIAEGIKFHFPRVHITIGGPQVNQYEEMIINENDCIDSVISYEGEETLYELILRIGQNKDMEGCLGVTYRNQYGKAVKNGYRRPVEVLDCFAFPSRDIHEKNSQQYLYITGSRGCVGGCSFCGETSAKKDLGKPFVRCRNAKLIVDEIEYLIKKYDVKAFRFTDATFEDPIESETDRAEQIFDEIIKRELHISLHLFTRAEIVNIKTVDYYKKALEAGVECFYLGIESGNESDLKLYRKRTTVRKNIRAIKKIRQAGIHVGMGFINFNPYSTFDSILKNAKFMRENGLGHVFYLMQTRLELLPQSFLRNKLIEESLIVGDFNFKSSY